tara:strand:- start:310 stop:1041 length:732 start_codon:yes stop_codon:yes gene_type:complete
MKTLIIIPSRLSATRLPGKPLLKINGMSIISHVFKKAEKADIGEVVVAAEDKEIVDDVKENGGQALLTKNTHKTGTDRIYEAFIKLGKKDIDLVMNLQGDEPLMDIEDMKNLNDQMRNKKSHLGTLASKLEDKKFNENQNIVKVITKENFNQSLFPKAKNFTRSVSSDPNTYHHLGVYCYQVETLKKFVSLNQSDNEIRDKLEQLRALDNGIDINVALAKSAPIGLDTYDDFVAIKKIMEYKS